MGILHLIPGCEYSSYMCSSCKTCVCNTDDVKFIDGIFNDMDVCFTFVTMYNIVLDDVATLGINGDTVNVKCVYCKCCNNKLGYKDVSDFYIFKKRIL